MSRSRLVAIALGSLSLLFGGCGRATVSSPQSSGPAAQTSDQDNLVSGNRLTQVVPAETNQGPVGQDSPTESKVDAEQVLAAALDRAQREDKRLLVHIGAPW